MGASSGWPAFPISTKFLSTEQQQLNKLSLSLSKGSPFAKLTPKLNAPTRESGEPGNGQRQWRVRRPNPATPPRPLPSPRPRSRPSPGKGHGRKGGIGKAGGCDGEADGEEAEGGVAEAPGLRGVLGQVQGQPGRRQPIVDAG